MSRRNEISLHDDGSFGEVGLTPSTARGHLTRGSIPHLVGNPPCRRHSWTCLSTSRIDVSGCGIYGRLVGNEEEEVNCLGGFLLVKGGMRA